MNTQKRTFEMGLHMAFIAMVMQLVFAIGHGVQAAGASPAAHSSDLLSALSFICTGDQIEKRDASDSDLPKRDCPTCLFAGASFVPPALSEGWVVAYAPFRNDVGQWQPCVQNADTRTFHQRAPPFLT